MNYDDPNFKVGDRVRISKYKTFLLKGLCLIGVKRYLLLLMFLMI